MKFLKIVQVAVLAAAFLPQTLLASSGAVKPLSQEWGFKGAFGKFDQSALKRGAQIAVEVCMACHSIKYIKFDSLAQFGFTEAEIEAMAEGQGRTKKDKMVSSMDNETAKESFGIVPPDLSLMTKARKGYEDYLYGILTGYLSESDTQLIERVMEDDAISETEALELAVALHVDARHPEQIKEVLGRIDNGANFNKYFPGQFFAMPAPLADGAVEYADGTESSLKQMAHDVVTFLAWTAEPTMMERKALGFKVILYLIILTVMLYAVKRRIWAKVH
ncbi:MAG: cytochrome c1 [Magnetococcales bacterium]|nr:cytochrome c1 [Magnetococcales bacterium]